MKIRVPESWICTHCGHREDVDKEDPFGNTPNVCPECDGTDWSASDEYFEKVVEADDKGQIEYEYDFNVKIKKMTNSNEVLVRWYDNDNNELHNIIWTIEDILAKTNHWDTGSQVQSPVYREWFLPMLDKEHTNEADAAAADFIKEMLKAVEDLDDDDDDDDTEGGMRCDT